MPHRSPIHLESDAFRKRQAHLARRYEVDGQQDLGSILDTEVDDETKGGVGEKSMMSSLFPSMARLDQLQESGQDSGSGTRPGGAEAGGAGEVRLPVLGAHPTPQRDMTAPYCFM